MNASEDTAIHLVLITGMSGSGKSVALTALEDVGFYCVDNLPPELLEAFIELEQSHQAARVAIAMDVRSAASLPGLPKRLVQLQRRTTRPVHLTTVFLDATPKRSCGASLKPVACTPSLSNKPTTSIVR